MADRMLGSAFLVVLLVVSIPQLARGQCAIPLGDYSPTVGGYLSVSSNNATTAQTSALQAGMNQWNSACSSGPGGPIPQLVAGGSYLAVNVQFYTGRNDGRVADCGVACGCAKTRILSGRLDGGTIHSFEETANGTSCTNRYESFFAHELGHIFGLDNSTCGIMGPSWSSNSVTSSECAAVNGFWQTPNEGQKTPDTGGEGCSENECPSSPLVVDLIGNGIHTSGGQYPVRFDIDGDGVRELLGWTLVGTDDAFLWLDLNGNGVVDDGRELFGTATVLPGGRRATHGFEALAVYDLLVFGGNGDGIISAADGIWHSLRLWVDFDQDGQSQKRELSKLNQSKLVALGLDYIAGEFYDGAGAGHLYQGSCLLRRKHERGWILEAGAVHDLFFPVVAQE